jgi:hypothetical protein
MAVGRTLFAFDGRGSIDRVVETLQNLGCDRRHIAIVGLPAVELVRAGSDE